MKFKQLLKNHWYVLIIPVGIVLDQVSKYIARENLTLHNTIWIIEDLFGWTLSYNYGAAWSVLSEATWLLTIFSIVMTLGVCYFYYLKRNEMKPLYKIVTVFIITGAIGNLIDRAFAGKVTDFINFNFFYFFDASFPIFNIADMFVVAAMIGIVILCLFDKDFDKILSLKKKSKNDSSSN
jgi:signal peptidase II